MHPSTMKTTQPIISGKTPRLGQMDSHPRGCAPLTSKRRRVLSQRRNDRTVCAESTPKDLKRHLRLLSYRYLCVKRPLSMNWIQLVALFGLACWKCDETSAQRPRRVATAIPPGAEARINCLLPKDKSVGQSAWMSSCCSHLRNKFVISFS